MRDKLSWETPQQLFDELNHEFDFDIDLCASSSNTKCQRYYSIKQNSLSKKWKGVCWLNPPYSRLLGVWIQKAYKASLSGATVVCLIPSSTDTSWWHDYVIKGEIRFLRGRLSFKNGNKLARSPFPCSIVIFRPKEG